jgi:hypothetical protein
MDHEGNEISEVVEGDGDGAALRGTGGRSKGKSWLSGGEEEEASTSSSKTRKVVGRSKKSTLDDGDNVESSGVDDDEFFKGFGWSVKMDHRFPEIWDSALIPRLKQLPDLLPLLVR